MDLRRGDWLVEVRYLSGGSMARRPPRAGDGGEDNGWITSSIICGAAPHLLVKISPAGDISISSVAIIYHLTWILESY